MNLIEQVLKTQRLGENIGGMKVRLQVQEWLIKWGKHIPVVAFAELKAIVGPDPDERAAYEHDMATRAAHSYEE